MIYFSYKKGELETIIENEYKDAAEALGKIIIEKQMKLAYDECLRLAKLNKENLENGVYKIDIE